ncbi:MAG: SDR family NAD(P)-dependent oxidoreductase [Gammaproteobacteria bacterium]|nr:SDR family NAD(P)-dependent oxidoreductase [Gammaproteobacteria bacterium]
MKISAGSTAVVTGGSSGLGRVLCLELARRGVSVAIADRDVGGAAETMALMPADLCELPHFAVACDIRRNQDFLDLRNEIGERWQGRLNLLVNNAGIARAGDISQTSEDDWQLMLDTNLMGVIRGCRELLPVLRASGNGYIVNVASFAGLANAPGMISYNVAKAGVIALSESLRGELRPMGIGVSVACPAFFATNLLNDFNAPPEVTQKVQRMMQRSRVQGIDVATDIVYAIEHERFMVISHGEARRAYLLKRLLPEWFFKAIQRQTSGLYGSRKGAHS